MLIFLKKSLFIWNSNLIGHSMFDPVTLAWRLFWVSRTSLVVMKWVQADNSEKVKEAKSRGFVVVWTWGRGERSKADPRLVWDLCPCWIENAEMGSQWEGVGRGCGGMFGCTDFPCLWHIQVQVKDSGRLSGVCLGERSGLDTHRCRYLGALADPQEESMLCEDQKTQGPAWGAPARGGGGPGQGGRWGAWEEASREGGGKAESVWRCREWAVVPETPAPAKWS